MHYGFKVKGINWLNPVTFADTNISAMFCATRDIAKGETIHDADCHPRMRVDGPHRNVTRLPTDTDVADW